MNPPLLLETARPSPIIPQINAGGLHSGKTVTISN